MSIESDLRTYLVSLSGVTAVVGERIYPNRLPDNPVLPAVVYRRISTNHNLASGKVPLTRARIQVDVWALTYDTCSTAAGALHTALDMKSPTGLAAVIPEDDDDSYDTDAQLHRRRLDIFVWRNN